MKRICGFVCLFKRFGRRAYIYGKEIPILEHSPFEFVPFDTIAEAKPRLERGGEYSFITESLIASVDIRIATTKEEEISFLSKDRLVIFSKNPGERWWRVFGKENNALLSLKPYTRRDAVMRKLFLERQLGHEVHLARWRIRIAYDPKEDVVRQQADL